MKTNSHRRLYLGALMLGVLAALLIDLWRDSEHDFNPLQFVRRPANFQTRDDAKLLSGWIDQVDNSWEVGKNHEHVRMALRDVVANARKSTVRIFRNNQQVAMGTIVDASGLLVTKASEVRGDEPISCRLYDGRRRRARRIGVSIQHDLALLRVNDRKLVPIKWHLDTEPHVGTLLATPHLGNAPLAIGVVSLSKQQIANNGVLGIRLQDTPDGPLVSDVIGESAAEEAGIRSGDVVVQVDALKVSDSLELVNCIGEHLPGDAVELHLKRGDEELSLQVNLGRRDDLDQENANFRHFIGGELSFRRSGFSEVLQHDTFLQPQHCGGPIVDLEGRVVGVNIARAERIASYALPAATVVETVNRLKRAELTAARLNR